MSDTVLFFNHFIRMDANVQHDEAAKKAAADEAAKKAAAAETVKPVEAPQS